MYRTVTGALAGFLLPTLILAFLLPSEAGQPPEEHLLKPLAASEQAVQPAEKLEPGRAHYFANDFYYYQGQRVVLHRSVTECAVQFRASLSDKAKDAIVSSLALPAKVVDGGQGEGRGLTIIKLEAEYKAESETAITALRAQQEVEFAFPVFINPKTGTRMLLTDELVIKLKLKPGRQAEEVTGLSASYGVTVVSKMWGTQDEYVLRVQDPKAVSPLEVANVFFESGLVEWAEPNFVQEYQKSFTPTDPLYLNQWHLNNTGQGGGRSDADVDAPEAWNLQRGSASITIAVLDDGVEINHEDLAANMFTNPREVFGNGIDDDGNGFVDDIVGWDFANNDNNPNPLLGGAGDSHGTSVAGVAAASGNNAIGVSGMCHSCKILPVKIANDTGPGQPFLNFSNEKAANALRYAASQTDILNNSWGGGSESDTIRSAIQYATTAGRGGKGSVVLFASGNNASGYSSEGGAIPAGTHRFRWVCSSTVGVAMPRVFLK
jgi:hypothetical protein